MCGLSVILGGDDRASVEMMNRAMAHRGIRHRNEAAGPWRLGHVRLPIVALSEEFDQPYRHAGWTFLFVGEIVNYRELIPEALSDVEVLARMWVSEGPACVRRFDGFWSIAAVPPHGRTVQVITDFLGKKPLYYRRDRSAFASEIKPLAKLAPWTTDEVYFSSVRKWGYHPGSRTWCREVRKIPPGTLIELDAMSGEPVVYEDFDEVLPSERSATELRNHIIESVRRRLFSSDVSVALLLSGGLDSSIILAVCRMLGKLPELYGVPEGSNPSVMEELLKGAPFTEVPLIDTSMEEEVLIANEGPVDLGSVFPQLRMALAVDERVVLSGDGADELFGGYKRSREYDSQGSDVFEELVHYHLPRLDKIMMRGTKELRCPFLGREVVRGALTLPREDRIDKRWLRRAFEHVLPPEIAYGTKVPLKSDVVSLDPIGHRTRMIDAFRKMLKEGSYP